jgi:MFS family permease
MFMNKIYLSQIIDERGGSRYSIFVLLLCCLAIMFDGYDYMIVSFTLPQISEELYLGEIAAGSLASWSMIGMMVGGFLGGVIADRIGRKKTLVFCVAVYSILTVPIFFVHSYDAFAICRIFSGIGIGAVIPLSQTLACEYAPTKHRGLFFHHYLQ